MKDGYDRLIEDLRASLLGPKPERQRLAEESFLAEQRVMDLIDRDGEPVQRAPEGADTDDFRHLRGTRVHYS